MIYESTEIFIIDNFDYVTSAYIVVQKFWKLMLQCDTKMINEKYMGMWVARNLLLTHVW